MAYDSFSPAAKYDTDRDAERLTIRLGGDRYAVPTKLEDWERGRQVDQSTGISGLAYVN